MNKPMRKAVDDDLPSIDSHDEDNDSWSSGVDDKELAVSDVEMPYEIVPRRRRSSWDSDSDHNIHHLPTKLPDGRIQRSVAKPTALPAAGIEADEESESETSDQEQAERRERYRVEDVSTGARFGRPAVADVIGNKSRKARIQGATDQIARICQEIIADPENSVSTSRQLLLNSEPLDVYSSVS